MKKLLLYLFLTIVSLNGISQDYRYVPGDTVKAKYPYSLPIFGNFLHDVGVDLPYPLGVMGNFFYGVQDINITDIKSILFHLNMFHITQHFRWFA